MNKQDIETKFKDNIKKVELELRELENGHKQLTSECKLMILDMMMFHDVNNYKEIASLLGREEEMKATLEAIGTARINAERTKAAIAHRERFLKRLWGLLQSSNDPKV